MKTTFYKFLMTTCMGLSILTGCSKTKDSISIEDNASIQTVESGYYYSFKTEKADFILCLNENHKYNLQANDEHISNGEWSIDDGKLLIAQTSGFPCVNYFQIQESSLVFQSDISNNFAYSILADGDVFELIQNISKEV